MKMLFVSYGFWPQVGGLEEVSRALALEFTRRGHEVRVITNTAAERHGDFPFQILRRPSAATLALMALWSEVVFHNNISLRYAWPLLMVRRPWVIAHHSFIQAANGELSLRHRLKRRLLRFGANLAVSRAIANDLDVPCAVVGDPYRAEVFRIIPGVERRKDLAFVGRLVTQKGVHVLLKALRILSQQNISPSLSIYGDGDERADLQELVNRLGLQSQVTFHGIKSDEKLARALNEHRIAIVPSVGPEAFGLAAIEAIACGCAVIASDIGGLKEAVGPCGWMVPPGDAQALADCVRNALSEKREDSRQHLQQFTIDVVASKYLEVIQGMTSGGDGGRSNPFASATRRAEDCAPSPR